MLYLYELLGGVRQRGAPNGLIAIPVFKLVKYKNNTYKPAHEYVTCAHTNKGR